MTRTHFCWRHPHKRLFFYGGRSTYGLSCKRGSFRSPNHTRFSQPWIEKARLRSATMGWELEREREQERSPPPTSGIPTFLSSGCVDKYSLRKGCGQPRWGCPEQIKSEIEKTQDACVSFHCRQREHVFFHCQMPPRHTTKNLGRNVQDLDFHSAHSAVNHSFEER